MEDSYQMSLQNIINADIKGLVDANFIYLLINSPAWPLGPSLIHTWLVPALGPSWDLFFYNVIASRAV